MYVCILLVGYGLWKSSRNADEVNAKRLEVIANANKRRAELGLAPNVVDSDSDSDSNRDRDSDRVSDSDSMIDSPLSVANGGSDGGRNLSLEAVPKKKDTHTMLKEAFGHAAETTPHEVCCPEVYGSNKFSLWWPHSREIKPKVSPVCYISPLQRMELLFRYAPLSAVAQKRGKNVIRLLIINTALLDKEKDDTVVGKLLFCINLFISTS